MDDRGCVFDTGALIDVYHGRSRVRPYFDRLFEASFPAFISPVSEAELWLGLQPGELERHEALLTLFVSLPLTSGIGCLAGEWMRRFGPKGLGWMDALIVATAAAAGVPALTRDQRLARVLSSEAEFILYE
ncbi:MAG: PIN domain-containing protein [Anaerolineae bacterium]|nr:PIN domain-containing protein [Anaerolineae bacterium]